MIDSTDDNQAAEPAVEKHGELHARYMKYRSSLSKSRNESGISNKKTNTDEKSLNPVSDDTSPSKKSLPTRMQKNNIQNEDEVSTEYLSSKLSSLQTETKEILLNIEKKQLIDSRISHKSGEQNASSSSGNKFIPTVHGKENVTTSMSLTQDYSKINSIRRRDDVSAESLSSKFDGLLMYRSSIMMTEHRAMVSSFLDGVIKDETKCSISEATDIKSTINGSLPSSHPAIRVSDEHPESVQQLILPQNTAEETIVSFETHNHNNNEDLKTESDTLCLKNSIDVEGTENHVLSSSMPEAAMIANEMIGEEVSYGFEKFSSKTALTEILDLDQLTGSEQSETREIFDVWDQIEKDRSDIINSIPQEDKMFVILDQYQNVSFPDDPDLELGFGPPSTVGLQSISKTRNKEDEEAVAAAKRAKRYIQQQRIKYIILILVMVGLPLGIGLGVLFK